MSWKPKEKDLTPEEAIELAKKELAPYWIGSQPLLAGIQMNGRFLALPLNAEFTKGAWLMLFVDSTEFRGENALFYIKEWNKRYSVHNLPVLIFYYPSYGYMKTPEVLQKLKDRQQFDFPIVIDSEGVLSAAFDAHPLPKVILFDKGKVCFERSGEKWLEETELNIQRFLRSIEPGLPLLRVYEPPAGSLFVNDTLRVEFGYKSKLGVSAILTPSGFPKSDGPVHTGKFDGERGEMSSPAMVYIKGEWQQDAEKITTSDPNALISFFCSASYVSLLAQSNSKHQDPSVITVEIENGAVFEAAAGDHLTLDDLGRSLVKVMQPQLYHILARLNSSTPVDVTLRFPNASMAPVSLYGLRFGK